MLLEGKCFVKWSSGRSIESFGIPVRSLFEAKGIAGNIIHAVATTNAIIAGLIVIEAIRVLQNDMENYRMTYCLQHPSRKMLLMPVQPFEPNKACYVCSESPLTLEVNTSRTKLRDFVEKIVKEKLKMNLPLIMHGSTLLYEVGDDLEEDMVASYNANLEKVLSELPSPVSGGTVLSVEDLQQELSCNINIKQREDFGEEKEADGMVLIGWTQAPAAEESKAAVENPEPETVPAAKKRKSTDPSGTPTSRPSADSKNKEIVLDDGDDNIVMLEGGDSGTLKKVRPV